MPPGKMRFGQKPTGQNRKMGAARPSFWGFFSTLLN